MGTGLSGVHAAGTDRFLARFIWHYLGNVVYEERNNFYRIQVEHTVLA